MLEYTRPGSISTQENVELINTAGQSSVVLVCEHASNFVPVEFAGLGLDDDALASHIAWDPGALAVAQTLSSLLDAPLVATAVSRLIYDCNRPTQAPGAVPEKSEFYDIPGNQGLEPSERLTRSERFYQPFRTAVTEAIDGVQKAGRSPVVITIHSFAPVYKGEKRNLDIGILHGTDARLADHMLAAIHGDGKLAARRNEPYGPADGVLFTLSEHAAPRRLLNAMIEIRNDLVADTEAQQAMAAHLAGFINQALADLEVDTACEVSS